MKSLFPLILTLIVAGCGPAAENREELAVEASKNVTAGDGYYLSETEIAELEPAARGGNVQAARRLTDYYQLYVSDLEKTTYWQRVGAENGDALATFNLASNLASRGTAESCAEALGLFGRIEPTTENAKLREKAIAFTASITEGRYEPCRGMVPSP
jgi:hypothetical protein